MLPAACLLAFIAAASTWELPLEAKARIAKLESGFSSVREGRRLLAETDGVRRLGVDDERALLVSYRRPEAAVVFNLARLSGETQWDYELSLARALSHAAQRIAFELPEGEVKALADELAFAVEKAAQDKVFAERFAAALKRQGELAKGERALGFAMKKPEAELEAAAYYGAQLLDSADAFERAVEASRGWPPVSFSTLSDFIERYGPEYRDVALSDQGEYARAGDRRYPGALYRAAVSLKELGGIAPVREALGPLESRTLPELRLALSKLQ